MTLTELTDAFLDGLHGLDDTDLANPGLVDEARRAGERLAAGHRWARITGERIDTATARDLLGITRQALHQRVTAGTILAVPGTSTTWYPTWQFQPSPTGGLQVRPVAARIITAFREQLDGDVDPLTLIGWAATGQPELNGATPKDWVAAGGDGDPVVLAASRAAWALAR